MTVSLEQFDQKFEVAHTQLASLLEQSQREQSQHPGDSPALLPTTVDTLANALEEVHVLSEELYVQHEQLLHAQETLQQERQQYYELFDLAPEGYLVTDKKAVIQHANVAAAKILNRPQALLLGKPLAALIEQSDLRDFYTLLTSLQEGAVVEPVGFHLQPAKQLPIYAAFTIAAVRDRQGTLTGVRWLFRDLTYQRELGTALIDSEAQYRTIVENQSELICRALGDGRITFVNQAFAQYFFQSPDSLMGKNIFEMILASERAEVVGQLALLNARRPAITLEYQTRSHGLTRWQQWSHRALFDNNGDLFQFQFAGRDISIRKQVEQDLHQRDEQFHLMADALPMLMASVDSNQQFVYRNQTFNQWFEPFNPVMSGQYVWEVLGQKIYQQFRVPIERALLGEENSFAQEIVLPEGGSRWVRATLVPHQSGQGQTGQGQSGQGKPEKTILKGFFWMVIDISQQKLAEAEKDQFLSMASHELRTPLTTIYGAIDLLQNHPLDFLDPDSQEILAMASHSSQHLTNLVNDLLDYQQIRLGKMPFKPHRCEAADLIQTAIDLLQMMAQAHQVTLSTRPCNCQVWVDSDRMVQVLTNLISNAIKNSPPGGTVWVSTKQVIHPPVLVQAPHIKFQVQDQGEGIPTDQLAHLFEPFYQVEAFDAHRQAGTGLGLAICQQIIEQHRSSMTVDSRLGHGTTVSFILPLYLPVNQT